MSDSERSLYDVILNVLVEHDGLSLDRAEDRDTLAGALSVTLGVGHGLPAHLRSREGRRFTEVLARVEALANGRYSGLEVQAVRYLGSPRRVEWRGYIDGVGYTRYHADPEVMLSELDARFHGLTPASAADLVGRIG